MAERRLRPSPNVAAVLVLALLAGVLLLWQQPWASDATSDEVVPLPADASTRLTEQMRALSEADSEESFVAATGDLAAGQRFGRRTWRSLQAVAAPGTSFRYISGGDVADRPDGSFSVVSAGRRVASVPVWLVGAVTVQRAGDSTVLRVDGGDDRVPVDQMATSARSAVASVVPDATGTLVIVSPRTEAQMASILGQSDDAVQQIAAVTAGLDSESPERDVAVVLNPAVFDTMDARAAQIVMSHEATHALTSAVGTSAVDWVVEGFADYVALRGDTAPLSVSAGQILAQVAAGQVPQQLPADGDFGSTQHGLGAVYESAWLIFRLLGETHSDRQIVAFYDSVIGGEPVEQALEASFGLSVAQLTDQWRAYLTKSASTVS